MYCKYCGHKLPDGSEYCTECGKKQSANRRVNPDPLFGEGPEPATAPTALPCRMMLALCIIAPVLPLALSKLFYNVRLPAADILFPVVLVGLGTALLAMLTGRMHLDTACLTWGDMAAWVGWFLLPVLFNLFSQSWIYEFGSMAVLGNLLASAAGNILFLTPLWPFLVLLSLVLARSGRVGARRLLAVSAGVLAVPALLLIALRTPVLLALGAEEGSGSFAHAQHNLFWLAIGTLVQRLVELRLFLLLAEKRLSWAGVLGVLALVYGCCAVLTLQFFWMHIISIQIAGAASFLVGGVLLELIFRNKQ